MNELTIYEEDRLTLTDYAAEEITKIEIAMKDLKRKKDGCINLKEALVVKELTDEL